MANLNTKYHVHYFPDLGVTLKRFYIWEEDELGSPYFWKEYLQQLYDQMPFKELWNNLKIEIWHMDHPDLLKLMKKGAPTLLDFRINVPGMQVATGLYFGKEKIALAVFPPKWRSHNPSNPIPVSQDSIIYTAKTLSHEIGHWYFDQSGFFTDKTLIGRILTDEYMKNKMNQTENVHENAAEEYRLILGTDNVRGTFSDNKRAVAPEKLKALIKMGYMLYTNNKRKNVFDFKLHNTWCEWKEWHWFTVKKRALTQNWDRFEWRDNGWRIIR